MNPFNANMKIEGFDMFGNPKGNEQKMSTGIMGMNVDMKAKGIDKDGNVCCLSDYESGYDGKDISIPLLAKFLKDYGYELVDER